MASLGGRELIARRPRRIETIRRNSCIRYWRCARICVCARIEERQNVQLDFVGGRFWRAGGSKVLIQKSCS